MGPPKYTLQDLEDQLREVEWDLERQRAELSAQIIPLQAQLEIMLELQRKNKSPEKIIDELYRELRRLREQYFELL